jgi:hypothetical protein
LAAISRFDAASLAERLRATLATFADSQIEIVLLKGAALGLTVYPDFADRPMGDLDVLVRAEDLDRAREAARRAGWADAKEMYPSTRYERHFHAPPLLDASGTGVRLELHTELFLPGHRFGLSREDLLATATPLAGTPGRVLVASHLTNLLHTCLHFAWSHMMRFGVWRMISDVTRLTSQPGVDWDAIVRYAREHRAASCCYWCLLLANTYGGADVPEEVLRKLAPYGNDRVLRLLARHFAVQVLPSHTICPSEQLSSTLWRAAIRPGRSGHGKTRPWHLTEEVAEHPGTPALPVKLARHAFNLGAWQRYLRHTLLALAMTA